MVGLFTACDRTKVFTKKAKSWVESKVPDQASQPFEKTHPELKKLVDQTSEGIIFRKDLPFPKSLAVEVIKKREIALHSTEKSFLGSQATTRNGMEVESTKFKKDGDQFQYQLIESSYSEEAADAKSDQKKWVKKDETPPSLPLIFSRSGEKWKSQTTADFRSANLVHDLEPKFAAILSENGVLPRTIWFGKQRIRLGESVKITAKMLPMLFLGCSEGKISLTLESIGSIDGHPCGAFSCSGYYRRERLPDFTSTRVAEEVSIRSGKLWLSMIYPLVLREEFDSIQTLRKGTTGSATTVERGSARVTITRSWKSSES